ncbi:MAG: saccharopine dehydrogenase NADP-binding domain-containing protein [Bdellovibrionales bacterium]|nr:saccharopine dehydrogenase NADP-binding domain-containing protein [Bdellovibrionales bacterium]
MKVLIVGCGMQSYGMALDVVKFGKPTEIILADAFPDVALKLKNFIAEKGKFSAVKTAQVEASNIDAVAALAKTMDLILNGCPYKFALDITRAAIKARVPMVDLGGDTDMVLKQLELSKQAKEAGITIIPDCGMGPGMTNITVGHAMEILDTAESIITTDGGIPTHPKGPLFYHLVFAIETLTNEYTGMTQQMRGGKIVDIAPLAEIYPLDNFPVVGKVEATHGMGMLSTLPWTYQGRVDTLENRFVRYPGHLRFIKTLVETGFFSREKLKTEMGEFQPRAMTKAILEKFLMPKGGEKDVSIIQTISKGKGKDGKKYEIEHLIVDYSDADTGLTSMQRTTGFTGAMVGQMIVNGAIKEKGVLPPELGVPKLPFFEEIKKRGFEFNWKQTAI